MVNVFLGFILAVAITAPPSTTPAAPDPAPSPSPSPAPRAVSVEDLYRAILPRPLGTAEAVTDVPAAAPGTTTGTHPPSDDPNGSGLYIGRAKITAALNAEYVHAESTILSAEPVSDSYYAFSPRVGAEAPLGAGSLRVGYEADVRRGSSFEIVDSTLTHLADLSLQIPVGPFAELNASEHYAHGILETAEVDPGREYFFGLGRFTHHVHSASLRLLPGGRADAMVGGSLEAVRVDDRSTFFDHHRRALSGQIGYEVRPDVRASVAYSYTDIPAPEDRPQVESIQHAVSGELRGEILPLTTGSVSVGYSSQTSPNAGPGGNRFTGLTVAARLEKSFTPSSTLTLSAARGTHVSAFEENAFYVSSSVQAVLRATLPWSFAGEVGGGYHRNDYRTIALAIGAPRRDVIRGVTFGLARPVTRHAFVRADYRRDRRDSNIDTFDSHSNVLTVQLGIGMFAGPSPLR